MGDPSKPRKQYVRPQQMWQTSRIQENKNLIKEYGLKNQKEIWRTEYQLRTFTKQAKRLIAEQGTQAELEKKQLMDKLLALGVIDDKADLTSVLNLTVNNLLERRLQTVVFRKNLARSIKQARQFIRHEAIVIGDKKISVPSYLVKKSEEDTIGFSEHSSLSDAMHPERIKPEELKKPEVKEEKTEEEDGGEAGEN